jgi:hypothetical protein
MRVSRGPAARSPAAGNDAKNGAESEHHAATEDTEIIQKGHGRRNGCFLGVLGDVGGAKNAPFLFVLVRIWMSIALFDIVRVF